MKKTSDNRIKWLRIIIAAVMVVAILGLNALLAANAHRHLGWECLVMTLVFDNICLVMFWWFIDLTIRESVAWRE